MNIHEGKRVKAQNITGHQDLLINKEAYMDFFLASPSLKADPSYCL